MMQKANERTDERIRGRPTDKKGEERRTVTFHTAAAKIFFATIAARTHASRVPRRAEELPFSLLRNPKGYPICFLPSSLLLCSAHIQFLFSPGGFESGLPRGHHFRGGRANHNNRRWRQKTDCSALSAPTAVVLARSLICFFEICR